MSYNINHGWGRIMADSVFSNRVHAGKKFLVIASTNANWDKYTSMLPLDPDGVVRVHPTLAAALTAATADQDDVIYVAPNHSENITAAAGVAMSKAGVSVIGLGTGNSRPTFTWTTVVGASWDVSAANCRIENIKADLTGVDAVTAGFNISAANAWFHRCEVVTATSAGQATLGMLTTAAANGFTLTENYFRGTNDVGTTAAVRIVGGTDQLIRGNTFIGAYTTSVGAIQGLTTDCDRTVIQDNFIMNLTAASTKAMVFASGSTVVLVGNKMHIFSGRAPITAAKGVWIGDNQYTVAQGQTAIMLVRVSANF